MAMLFDIVNPAPAIADTSMAAWDGIKATLTEREIETMILIFDYLDAHPQFSDVTGGELAQFGRRMITSIRPRITGLIDKGWLASQATRKSLAPLEGSCHPVSPLLSRSAIERARKAR